MNEDSFDDPMIDLDETFDIIDRSMTRIEKAIMGLYALLIADIVIGLLVWVF